MLHFVPASTATPSSSPGRAKAAEIPPPADSSNVEVLLHAEGALSRFAASTNETVQCDLPLIRLGQQFITLAIAETRADLVAARLDVDTTVPVRDDEALRAAGARADEAAARVTPLVNAIFRTPARGLAGLFVKAAAARWCNGGSFMAERTPTSDADNNAVAGSIVDDLLAMAGEPVSCQPSQAVAGRGEISADPVFAAIERHRDAVEYFDVLYAQIDEIERAASYSDPRPSALVSWHNYGAISGIELDRARDYFLAAPNPNQAQIAREYRQKKAEFRSLQMAQRRWDKKHGTIDLRRRAEACRRKCTTAEQLLENCEPTTIAGAAALAEYAQADLEIGGAKWPIDALRTVARTLKRFAPSPRLADAASASADAADPVFAAIECHRATLAELENIGDAGDPAVLAQQPHFKAADDAERTAALQLTGVQPTTMAGAIALLRWVYEYFEHGGIDWPVTIDGAERPVPWTTHMLRRAADNLDQIERALAAAA
jgi:hypothetical protein